MSQNLINNDSGTSYIQSFRKIKQDYINKPFHKQSEDNYVAKSKQVNFRKNTNKSICKLDSSKNIISKQFGIKKNNKDIKNFSKNNFHKQNLNKPINKDMYNSNFVPKSAKNLTELLK